MIIVKSTVSVSSAQDIIIENPSLEKTGLKGGIPLPWYKCGNTPDLQPNGGCGITLPAADGKTYVGSIGSTFPEGLGLNVEGKLKAGKTYVLSFDLAYPPYYCVDVCYGSFAIYGGATPCDKTELLWESGAFYHKDWKRYTAVFKPTRDYAYISFWTYPVDAIACHDKKYAAFLVDNFSPAIREVPQIELVTRNSCKGGNTGSALVRVKGGQAPYHYVWSPGGNTTAEIANLRAGVYEVTVTGANGAVIKEEVNIEESEVKAAAFLTPVTCYGLSDATIDILASGGTPPYNYNLNNGSDNVIQEEPAFTHLKAGTYKLQVKDTRGCGITLNYLSVNQPSPLQVTSAYTKPVSCNETKDGKITLEIKGGTTPYSYSLDTHSWQPDSAWNQLDAGRYYFQVKDKNGCKVTGETEIVKNWRDCAVFVPTAFSPNGDGINDVFRAKVHDDVYNYRLTVFNRWGQQIFQSNDPAQGWDGGQQTTGNYLWVLMYTDSKHQARKQQGNLILIR